MLEMHVWLEQNRCPPIIDRSVNPITTGEGRLFPPITTGTQKIFHLPASLVINALMNKIQVFLTHGFFGVISGSESALSFLSVILRILGSRYENRKSFRSYSIFVYINKINMGKLWWIFWQLCRLNFDQT